jgi:hypothetical protein
MMYRYITQTIEQPDFIAFDLAEPLLKDPPFPDFLTLCPITNMLRIKLDPLRF